MRPANTDHWSERVSQCEQQGRSYVIVTVLGARGSTPRNSGTKMIVEGDGFLGTIGGGELEHRALRRARELLANASSEQVLENFPLGEKLGQCCGGSVSLLFEVFRPVRPEVFLFGAGHVGRALAPLLSTLPLRLTWVDERTDEMPASVPEGVTALRDCDAVSVLRGAPARSYFLIMTHQHPLDYALAEAALLRGDAAFVGVIGSQSKARRFRMRLTHRGLAAEQLAELHCPIGMPGVEGKVPAEIAVAVAAQVINRYQALRVSASSETGPSWKAMCEDLSAAGQAALVASSADRSPQARGTRTDNSVKDTGKESDSR
ncbi:MAG: xanthine dehydrogenase accessory protein XdhC [Pseudomonadota bacterium]